MSQGWRSQQHSSARLRRQRAKARLGRCSSAWPLVPAAIAAAAMAPPVNAGVSYNFFDLNPTGYSTSTGYGEGPAQQVGYGSNTGATGEIGALVWSAAANSYININPSTFTQSNAFGAWGGWIVGEGLGSSTGGNNNALLWMNESTNAVNLNPSGFTISTASGIFRTQIVGQGYGPSTSNSTNALLWTGTSAASVIDLNPAGFLSSIASAVSLGNEVGNGLSATTGYLNHALLWAGTSNAAADLNPKGFTNSYAKGIFANQEVGYGSGSATANATHALLWNGSSSTAVDLNPTGFSLSYAYGVNAATQVGYAYQTSSNTYHAIAWTGSASTAVDLNPSGYSSSIAIGIDPYGIITGYVYTPTGVQHAAMWMASNNAYYTNSASTGAFAATSNWITGSPSSGQNAYLVQADTVNRTISYTASPSFGSLMIDATGSGMLTLSQGQDTLTTTANQTVGYLGNGVYAQSGGTNSVGGNLLLGQYTGASGTYTLSAGKLSIAGTLSVGSGGLGSFNQSSGTSIIAQLLVGDASTAWGTMGLSGGSISALSATVGNNGYGGVVHSGGTLALSGSLTLGNQATGLGTYALQNNATLSVGANLTVGAAGVGSFSQSGGTVSVSGTLYLATSTSGAGVYTLTGGTLSGNTAYVGSAGGTGLFQQNGGLHTLNTLIVGTNGSYGTYNLASGTLVATSLLINPRGGGIVPDSGPGIGPDLTLPGGIFNYTGGNLTAAVTNSGNFNISTGGSRSLGAIVNTSTGIMSVTSTSLTITGSLANSGIVQTVSNGATLSLASSAYLTGSSGSTYKISGDLLSSSTQNLAWNTISSILEFTNTGPSIHNFSVTGADEGRTWAGMANDFAWGTVQLDSGQSLVLQDGNSTPGGALYTDAFILQGGVSQISSITGNGFNIYYDATNSANAYLDDKTYSLSAGGLLEPITVPEPSGLIWLPLAAGFLLRRRKRRA